MTELYPSQNVDPHVFAGDLSVRLPERSRQNIAVIRNSFIEAGVENGMFATAEAADEAISEREAAIESDHRLTINMSAESLNRFLTTGHSETHWDGQEEGDTPKALGSVATLNGKLLDPGYDDRRKTAEDALRKYAPEDATSQFPQYTALAGPADMYTGAAPSYGNCWIELDGALEERAVYNFSDSHASVQTTESGMEFDESTVLDAKDAFAAKAITDMAAEQRASLGLAMAGNVAQGDGATEGIMRIAGRYPGYVEGIVFDKIKLDQVTGIGINIQTAEEAHAAGRLIGEHPEFAEHFKVVAGEDTNPAVKDWLKTHVQTPIEADEQTNELSSVWDKVGLSPEATKEEIAESLTRQSALRLKELSDLTLGNSGIRMANFKDGVQWQNYMGQLRAASRNQTGRAQQLTQEFIELQEARLFFST